MNYIKQGGTSLISIDTGLELEALSGLEIGIFQDGHRVLSRTLADCEFEGAGLSFRLEGWETENMAPRRFAIELKATDGTGSHISRSIEGLVLPSVS